MHLKGSGHSTSAQFLEKKTESCCKEEQISNINYRMGSKAKIEVNLFSVHIFKPTSLFLHGLIEVLIQNPHTPFICVLIHHLQRHEIPTLSAHSFDISAPRSGPNQHLRSKSLISTRSHHIQAPEAHLTLVGERYLCGYEIGSKRPKKRDLGSCNTCDWKARC